jgi:hypothetical protein
MPPRGSLTPRKRARAFYFRAITSGYEKCVGQRPHESSAPRNQNNKQNIEAGHFGGSLKANDIRLGDASDLGFRTTSIAPYARARPEKEIRPLRPAASIGAVLGRNHRRRPTSGVLLPVAGDRVAGYTRQPGQRRWRLMVAISAGR